MGQTGLGPARQRTAHRLTCALFCLLAPAAALGQPSEAEVSGSVRIEQAVGGSFVLRAANQAFAAVFQPRSFEIPIAPSRPAQTAALVYSALIAPSLGQTLVYAGDAQKISLDLLGFSGVKHGQVFVLEGNSCARDRRQTILVLVNFN